MCRATVALQSCILLCLIACAHGGHQGSKNNAIQDERKTAEAPPRPTGCDELYKVAVEVAHSAVARQQNICHWTGDPVDDTDSSPIDANYLVSRRPVCNLGDGETDIWDLYDRVKWEDCGVLSKSMAAELVRFKDFDHLPGRPFSALALFNPENSPLYYVHARSATAYAWSADFYKVMNSVLDRRPESVYQALKEVSILGDGNDIRERCDQMLQSAVVYTAGLTSLVTQLSVVQSRKKSRDPVLYRAGNGKSELNLVQKFSPEEDGGLGDVFEWRGFMSTAEEGYVWNGRVKWVITDKARSGGDLGIYKQYNTQEREYLLHPYTRLRISKTEKKDGSVVVHAETTLDPVTEPTNNEREGDAVTTADPTTNDSVNSSD